ncbi:MAG: HAMP domain-containing histidine kinase [Saprospiraceae bacterium]|nr:HAMP domain-containing histidine kinase [Saprospiraceae bacterium]
MNNKLFWKISGVFLFILIAVATVFIYVTVFTSQMYYEEVNQKLNANIAAQTVQEVKPLVNGKVDTNAIQDIMHSMMVINPSVEVYLLDVSGKIITYVAPYKKVKLDNVSLEPIREFIERKDHRIVKGDDPRNPGQEKVFSAAVIEEGDKTQGYIYVILASEEQTSAMSMLFGSFILKIGARTIIISILVAIALGLFAFLYLTDNLHKIMHTVRRFKEGDLGARANTQGDFAELGETFNEMADQIVGNINQLKSVEKLRRELIANVSHDLRTPLSVMSGYIETLLMKKDLTETDRKKYLQIVHNSSENLSKLIDQLFEYSKLEAKEIIPEKEPFQIADLIQDIVMKFEVIAAEKNMQIQMDASPQLPMVFADIGLVERAISNLLDNAVKYGKQNGLVSIKLQSSPEAVSVHVTDDGPGIPESDQSHIFERYRRGDRTEIGKKGAGLGLAIVKKILEIHNQSIRVFSEAGKGATFIFNLPTYHPA